MVGGGVCGERGHERVLKRERERERGKREEKRLTLFYLRQPLPGYEWVSVMWKWIIMMTC
jgi:hypothetical protein